MLKRTPSPIHNPAQRARRAFGAAGFTMIELMVSVSIMILLVGGGIASFITFNDKQQLQNSTKLIQTYLRTAQTKARVGDRPEGCDKLDGYEVQVPNGTTTINLVAVCDGTDIQVQSTQLENVQSISVEGGGDLEVLFRVLHGGTENEGTITVTSDGGTTETFHVSAGGEISELGYDVTNDAGSSGASPSPSSATQASPSPSVSPSPTNLGYGIFLNAASGMSCSQFCVQQDFVRCDSIGTDTAATNSTYMTKTLSACATSTGSCTTTFSSQSLTCASQGTTAAASWSYCKCSN